MAALTPIPLSRAGADISTLATAGAGGDTFPAGSATYLRIKNGNAAVCTPTFTPPAGGGKYGTTVAPWIPASVAATTGDKVFGPFPAETWADANGNVNVTYSVTATVSVQVLQAV